MIYEFDARILKHPDLDAAFVEFPYNAEKEFGQKRIKVRVLFDGVEYRGLLVNMKWKCHFIGLNAQVRKAIGKGPGDTVHVQLQQDLEERVVEIPADMKQALEEAGVLERFQKLSYTHQKEHVRAVEEARKAETRQKRIEAAVYLLKG